MELEEFHRNPQNKRLRLVSRYGLFLLSRLRGIYLVSLYDMGVFFAEIWYNRQTDKVELVRGFKNMTHLTPYLEAVNISELTGE